MIISRTNMAINDLKYTWNQTPYFPISQPNDENRKRQRPDWHQETRQTRWAQEKIDKKIENIRYQPMMLDCLLAKYESWFDSVKIENSRVAAP